MIYSSLYGRKETNNIVSCRIEIFIFESKIKRFRKLMKFAVSRVRGVIRKYLNCAPLNGFLLKNLGNFVKFIFFLQFPQSD